MTLGDRSDRLRSSELANIGDRPADTEADCVCSVLAEVRGGRKAAADRPEDSALVLTHKDGLPLDSFCSSSISIESLEDLAVLTVDAKCADDCLGSRGLMDGCDNRPAEDGLGKDCSLVLAEKDGRAIIGVRIDVGCSVEAERTD